MKNYYQTLAIKSDANFKQIKVAYRRKALTHHPDRGGSHKKMVEVNEAWEVLSNQKLRQKYDVLLQSGKVEPEQFAEARSRSKDYERDWSKFDKWLNAISNDFSSAEFSSSEMFGMNLPTASGSVSAWVFLITGGLAGLLLWAAVFGTVYGGLDLTDEREPAASRDFSHSRVKRNSDNKFSPVALRVILVTAGISICGGASVGRWAHQTFGASIASWLPASIPFPFSSSQSVSLNDSPKATGSSESKPPDRKRQSDCPKCKQTILVPESELTLRATCPKCRHQFDVQPPITSQPWKAFMNFPPSKTDLATLLRGLLIFEICFGIVVFVMGIIETSMGDEFLLEAGVSQELSDLQTLSVAVFGVALVVLIPALIASWVGLFQQKNWSRWLYLFVSVASCLLMVFFGFFHWTYRWGVVEALESLTSVVSGLILAICFLSPLASEFNSNAGERTE